MKSVSIAIMAAAALLASHANATVIAYDNFTDPSYLVGGYVYPVNSGPTAVYGPNDGFGWSTGWEGSGGGNVTSPRTVAPGLSYAGLATSGHGAASMTYTSADACVYCVNSTALRGFTSNSATSDLWVSFLIQDGSVSNANFSPYPNYAGFSVMGSNDGFFIGLPGITPTGTANYSLQTYAAIEQSSKPASLGHTDLLVADIKDNGHAYLYVDPTIGAPLGAPDATIATSLTPGAATGLYWTDSWGWNYSDVRVGTSLADVTPAAAVAVPEPATWALMMAGMGALGAVLRRRRQGVFVAA